MSTHMCPTAACAASHRLDYLWRPSENEWRKSLLDNLDMRDFTRRPLSDAEYRDALEVMLGIR